MKRQQYRTEEIENKAPKRPRQEAKEGEAALFNDNDKPLKHGNSGKKEDRSYLSLEKKIEIIRAAERQKLGQRALATKFNISKSSIQRILRRRAEYIQDYTSNYAVDNKRKVSKSKGDEVNLLVWKWYQAARAKGIPVTGPKLQQRALSIANRLGNVSFKGSNGWLDSFKRRYKILHKSANPSDSTDGTSLPLSAGQNWSKKLELILDDYEPSDVYVVGESVLEYANVPLPPGILSSQGLGANQRGLTVLFCCNMAGEKERLLVVSNEYQPRDFSSFSQDSFPISLPVDWHANDQGWMTQRLFCNWLERFETKMLRQKRNVLLLMDDNAAHLDYEHLNLSRTRIMLFPSANANPLRLGIIQAWKLNYRRRLLSSVLPTLEQSRMTTSSLPSSSLAVDVSKALHWMSECWKSLALSILKESFAKAHLHSAGKQSGRSRSNVRSLTSSTAEEDIHTALEALHDLLSRLWEAAQHHIARQRGGSQAYPPPLPPSVQEYVNVDDARPTSCDVTLSLATGDMDVEALAEILEESIVSDYLTHSRDPKRGRGQGLGTEGRMVDENVQRDGGGIESNAAERDEAQRDGGQQKLERLRELFPTLTDVASFCGDLSGFLLHQGVGYPVIGLLLDVQTELFKFINRQHEGQSVDV